MSSPEIMRRIAEAERESGRLVDEAERAVSRMRREIPEKTASIREGVLREAAAQKEKTLLNAQEQGTQEAERIGSLARMRVEALSKISDDRRRRALEKAMSLVTS
jgi:vacuolar-type H+-ATPase subunit H